MYLYCKGNWSPRHTTISAKYQIIIKSHFLPITIPTAIFLNHIHQLMEAWIQTLQHYKGVLYVCVHAYVSVFVCVTDFANICEKLLPMKSKRKAIKLLFYAPLLCNHVPIGTWKQPGY